MVKFKNEGKIKELVSAIDDLFGLAEGPEPGVIQCDNCGKEQTVADWIYEQNLRFGGLQIQCPCGHQYLA
jgi:hypothetical protein